MVLNIREKNKAKMQVINCQQGIGRRYTCSGPEVETFLEVQTKNSIAGTDEARRRKVRGESQRQCKPDHREHYRLL